ncbi:hypothetical protein FGO68_gene16861 [Halteria grandinella]|uniref:Uncharacterized protein n=1 Tax=Halteria grandinella TaxID=5974 RepID=A0A8J8P4V2_HALGN|nr:hypothetical protein FGO68_gene16861 [Halteria grandinella]
MNAQSFFRSPNLGLSLSHDAPSLQSPASLFIASDALITFEMKFYTCQESEYYLFSRWDAVTQKEIIGLWIDSDGYYAISMMMSDGGERRWGTGVKALTGWNYLVVQVGKQGIAASIGLKQTKVTFDARSSNIETTYSHLNLQTSFTVEGIIPALVDTTNANPLFLFGHSGSLSSLDPGSTSLHLNGIIRSFKLNSGPLTPLSQATIDSTFNLMISTIRPLIPLELTYSMKFDLKQTVNKQYVRDLINPTSIMIMGAQQLVDDEKSDPIYLQQQGLMFDDGKFIKQTTVQSVPNPRDFTLEIWFRLNQADLGAMGSVQTLMVKRNKATYDIDFGVQLIVGKSVRIWFNNEYRDIAWKYNRTEVNGMNQEWRMLAVNFRRQQQRESIPSTQITVYSDDQPGVSYAVKGIYTDTLVNREIYMGLDFHGVIRTVRLYSNFAQCTYFSLNTTDSKYYEYYRYKALTQSTHYPLMTPNFNSSTCKLSSLAQPPCSICPSDDLTCPNTCPFSTYGSSCKACDPRCLYCTGEGPMNCLGCKTGISQISVFGDRQHTCMRDYGYYKVVNDSYSYQKCDYRCKVCKDETNKCEICADGAYRIRGNECVTECPAPAYQANAETGMCEPIQQYSQLSNCTQREIMVQGRCLDCKTVNGTYVNVMGQCIEICGKGFVLGMLGCDDGNNVAGDGCSRACEIEERYECNNSLIKKSNCTLTKTFLLGIILTDQNQILVQFSNKVRLTSRIKEDSKKKMISLNQALAFAFKAEILNEQTKEFHEDGTTLSVLEQFNLSLPFKYLPLSTHSNFLQVGTRLRLTLIRTDYFEDLNENLLQNSSNSVLSSISTSSSPQHFLSDTDLSQNFIFASLVQFFLVSILAYTVFESIVMFKPLTPFIVVYLGIQTIYFTSITQTQGDTLAYLQHFKTVSKLDFFGNIATKDLQINNYRQQNIKFIQAGFEQMSALANLNGLIWFWIIVLLGITPFLCGIAFIMEKAQAGGESNYFTQIRQAGIFKIYAALFYLLELSIVPASISLLLEIKQIAKSQESEKVVSLQFSQALLSILIISILMIPTVTFGLRYFQGLPIVKNLFQSTLYTPFRDNFRALIMPSLYALRSLLLGIILTLLEQDSIQYIILLHGLSLLYSSIFRPMAIFSQTVTCALMELGIVTHLIILNQGHGKEVMVSDAVIFGVIWIIVSVQHIKTFRKWYIWVKTGKIIKVQKVNKEI